VSGSPTFGMLLTTHDLYHIGTHRFHIADKTIKISVKKRSEFSDIASIEYFKFEEDFIEENVRCIPMIVRFKMDTAGIKLKLAEWSKFHVQERSQLAIAMCSSPQEVRDYHHYLNELVRKYTGHEGTVMNIDPSPGWADIYNIPGQVASRAMELDHEIGLIQWRGLTNLQRFALIKLARPGHESKNFMKALKEFGISK
jgi:hypothetical protein